MYTERMPLWRGRRAGVSIAITILAVAGISAHVVTYRGKVVAVETNRYAASDGVLGTIEIEVSPGGREMMFEITAHTAIWRGETPVAFADARIRAGEPIALTWVDEEPEKGAQEIRLGARSD